MSKDVWTPLELVKWTQEHFAKKGIEQPRLEAELLLAHVLGWQRIELYTHFEQAVAPEALAQFRELVKRRGAHEPRQYLIGTDEFYGLKLKVDKRVLIPRDETEHLVEETLKLVGESASATVVELCTGSGAVAVAIASKRKAVKVIAGDISKDALAVARMNVDALGLGERVELREGDLFEAIPAEFKGKVDVVVANPPYVSEPDAGKLPPEVREHEPFVALIAGKTGLEIIERILSATGEWLKPGGHLLMEIGAGQAKAVSELAGKFTAFGPAKLVKDYGKIERVVILRRG